MDDNRDIIKTSPWNAFLGPWLGLLLSVFGFGELGVFFM